MTMSRLVPMNPIYFEDTLSSCAHIRVLLWLDKLFKSTVKLVRSSANFSCNFFVSFVNVSEHVSMHAHVSSDARTKPNVVTSIDGIASVVASVNDELSCVFVPFVDTLSWTVESMCCREDNSFDATPVVRNVVVWPVKEICYKFQTSNFGINMFRKDIL